MYEFSVYLLLLRLLSRKLCWLLLLFPLFLDDLRLRLDYGLALLLLLSLLL